jgi:hypothetical protein
MQLTIQKKSGQDVTTIRDAPIRTKKLPEDVTHISRMIKYTASKEVTAAKRMPFKVRW